MMTNLREISVNSLEQWSSEYQDQKKWGDCLKDMPDAMLDEWLEVVEGRAVLVTPDGRKWRAPVCGELGEATARDEIGGVLLHYIEAHKFLSHQLGPRLHCLFFDVKTLSLDRTFCCDCQRWVDLNEEKRKFDEEEEG